MVTSRMRQSGDLVGRDQEMAALLDGVGDARAGSPSTVLLGGDAGIGKTRLLIEFVERVDEPVLWGGCLPVGERGVPYLPLVEMIRSLDDQTRGSLPSPLEILAPRGDDDTLQRRGSRPYLFQAVMEFFQDLSSHGPLIVVFEDVHWADRSTRDLLDFLVGLLRNQRILLVASFRADDLPADHPLRTSLAEWQRRPWVRRVDLKPLTVDDALRLLGPLLAESGATQEHATRLVERADGNPFFLEQLAAAGPDGPPGALRDLLLRRTHDLSPELLRLLRIAAAGGSDIDEEVLAEVAGLEADAMREPLREAIEAQLLVLDNRSCRFRHALVAEALHDDLLPAERREYHAAYADALVARPERVLPGELAAHQAEAGRVDEALGAWVVAAETAEAQFAFAEAEHGYRSALDLWDRTESPETSAGITQVELLRRVAEAAFLAGEAEVACEMARRAIEEIDEQRDPIAAGIMYHRLARYLRPTDESSGALAIQKRAVELIPESPPSPERAEVLSGLALMLQYDNRYNEARDVSLEAIELAIQTGSVAAETQAKNTLGNAICTLEDTERGLSIINEALDLARRTGNAHEQGRSIWNLQANRFLAARLSEYVENAEATLTSLRMAQPHFVVDQMVHTADALQMLGRWDEADAMLEAARREYPTLGSRIGVPELSVARGHLEEARTVTAARDTPVLGRDVTASLWSQVNLAQIEVSAGNPSDAIETIESAFVEYPGLDKPLVLGHGIAIGLRAAADLARSARIKGDAAAVEEAMANGEALHHRMAEVMAQPGPADGWKREVGCLAAQCDAEMSRLHGKADPSVWLRARDCWLALSMPYRAAYCRFRWAEDALASGEDRSEVEAEIRDLVDLLSTLGAKALDKEVRALARRARIDLGDRHPGDPYGLTDREVEVLTQVANGSTNRQIAEALFISEKTASVHVSNILRKLTVSNRGEAAAKALKEGMVALTGSL